MGYFYHMLSRWITLFIPATFFVIACFVKQHQSITMANYIAMMLLLYAMITAWEITTNLVCPSRGETEEVKFQPLYFFGLIVIFTGIILIRS